MSQPTYAVRFDGQLLRLDSLSDALIEFRRVVLSGYQLCAVYGVDGDEVTKVVEAEVPDRAMSAERAA